MHLVIQKAAFEKVINTKDEVFTGASLICNPLGVDGNNIKRKMALLNLDIILVPLEIAIVEFNISYLNIVMFFV